MSAKNIIKLIKDNKSVEVKKLLERLLKSYKSNSKIVDHIYLTQKKIPQ
mgnify:CR=1 FL=1